MKLVPVLVFDGNCSDAIAFYTEVFGAKQIKTLTYGENIEELKKDKIEVTKDFEDKIMHATITLPDDGTKIILHDKLGKEPFHAQSSVNIALEFATQKEMDDIYHKIQVGGTVNVPIQKVFWHAMYAVITDKFKKKWILNCQIVSID